MSKLTFLTISFCALALLAFVVAPASAAPADQAAKARSERVAPAAPDAATLAFLQSLSQGHDQQQTAKSPRRPGNKAQRVECTSDGPMTTCCGPCGCCFWSADEGSSPRCVSHC